MFDRFPLLNNDERVAVFTVLVLISRVDGEPSESKHYFLAELSNSFLLDKSLYPIESVPDKIDFSLVKSILKNLSENNVGQFFELVSSFVEIDEPPTLLELVLISKFLEIMGRTHKEYDDVAVKLKLYLAKYSFTQNKYYK
jgi:hypothetical protein